ncbi:LysR family transcriptional regulator [Bacillus suaedae]|uniref:LysR family transcriptional regulator n=1 Tax=Halalkalibacter suaedae TaxID=2822140 RepID=A0A940WUL1_9BACI|nr:LysR family transcriptional regulator [Bacillus suaedae]MBP3950752.1 LysR family transcriptional regulator [Bacillus suaedae]
MKTDDYKLLVMIKKQRTIRAAAKELLISQPAISQRLKQIEEQWGEKIFLRTHKQLIVTPVGEKIIALAERIISEENQLLDDISRMSDQVRGRLSLGVSSVVGQYLLPTVLQEYTQTFPEVEIELFTGLSQDIRQSMANFHLMIIRGEKLNQLNCIELFSEPLYLIERKDINPEHKNKLLIEFQSDHSFHSLVEQWLVEQAEIKISRKIKVDQIETCKQLMSHGIGMAVLPEMAMTNLNLNEYVIKPLVANEKMIKRTTWLCYTDIVRELPQVEAFFQLLKKSHFS